MKFTLIPVAMAALAAQQVLAGGPIAGCLQTHTVVANDSCEGIAAAFKLTPDQFYAMNPGLHHAGDHLCDNLDDGKPYCVCTKKPCVPEPAGGNSTSSAVQSASSSAASGSASSAAASSSVAPSSSAAVSSSAAASSSGAASSAASSSAAASSTLNKPNSATSSAPATALALSIVAIAAVVLL